MSKETVEVVKKRGIYEALFKATTTALWSAKNACEEAAKDDLMNFKREVAKARTHLDAAEEFLKELKNSD